MLVSVAARNASLAMSYGDDRGSLAPDSLEVALFDGDPANGGSEIAGGGYAPAVVPNDGTTWPDPPSAGQITSAIVEFPTSSGAWSASATYWLIRDAATSDEWDAMPLAEPINVFAAGVTARLYLTVNYTDLETP